MTELPASRASTAPSAESVFPTPRTFASDNYAGAHPEVLAAVIAANTGHAAAYGGDPWTSRFAEVARDLFGPSTESFPVFNGTGANVLGLQAGLPRWGAVVCASGAHINVDEGGAPERVGGMKLLTVDSPDGKLTPSLVDRQAWGWGDEHRAQPLAVSISQTTELGTCYTLDEVRALADHAHERGMILHMDGSRLGNAAAHLGCSLREITTDVGVDVLSLGGTKNGLLGAEAVLVLTPGAAPGIPYLRKLNLQLGSKMRFVSAQLLALYEGDLWHRSASHANAMAARLREALDELARSTPESGVQMLAPTESNAVFASLPQPLIDAARARFHFYDWPGKPGAVRLMCSFDTTPEDVDELVGAMRAAAQ